MFAKFTERARTALSLARDEALRSRSDSVRTEHFLLGIILESGNAAAKVLAHHGVEVARVDHEIKRLSTPASPEEGPLGMLPFSPRAKRVLVLAGEMVDALDHDVIGTEHLLLALMHERESMAARVLTGLEVNLADVIAVILELIT